jgi:hypothetical protein
MAVLHGRRICRAINQGQHGLRLITPKALDRKACAKALFHLTRRTDK